MSIASAIPIDDFFSVNATPSSPGGSRQRYERRSAARGDEADARTTNFYLFSLGHGRGVLYCLGDNVPSFGSYDGTERSWVPTPSMTNHSRV